MRYYKTYARDISSVEINEESRSMHFKIIKWMEPLIFVYVNYVIFMLLIVVIYRGCSKESNETR